MWSVEHMTKVELHDRCRQLERIVNEKNREIARLQRVLMAKDETIYELWEKLFSGKVPVPSEGSRLTPSPGKKDGSDGSDEIGH